MISAAAIDLWALDASTADVSTEALTGVLSADERARAAAFAFERDRRRFSVSRACLRAVLARYVDISPRELAFAYGPNGKPSLTPGDAAPTLAFNLSHTGDITLVAVSRGPEVGVDVELLRADAPIMEMARHHFAPEEADELARLPEALRRRAFFQCWVRKEALMKAQGGGLSIPPASFRVTTDPDAPPRLVSSETDAIRVGAWSLADIDVAPGVAAAIAVAGPPVLARLRRLPVAELTA